MNAHTPESEQRNKTACFVKRTSEGYKSIIEVILWFKPDFSLEFGTKSMFLSMFGSVVPWTVLAPVHEVQWVPPIQVVIIMIVSIFGLPVVFYPLYRAFGICFCEAKP